MGDRTVEYTRTGSLALALTCCWPGWPFWPWQLFALAASPLGLCWLAAWAGEGASNVLSQHDSPGTAALGLTLGLFLKLELSSRPAPPHPSHLSPAPSLASASLIALPSPYPPQTSWPPGWFPRAGWTRSSPAQERQGPRVSWGPAIGNGQVRGGAGSATDRGWSPES